MMVQLTTNFCEYIVVTDVSQSIPTIFIDGFVYAKTKDAGPQPPCQGLRKLQNRLSGGDSPGAHREAAKFSTRLKNN